MTVSQLREWLSAPRWAGNECAVILIGKLEGLDPNGEYLLVATEG